MAIELNHTIVASYDPAAAATWFAELMGLDPPVRSGPFWEVSTSNGVSLDFDAVDAGHVISGQHYAFLIGEDDFDAIFARIREQDLDYYADPFAKRPREINRNDGGRGLYFPDPSG